MGEREAGRVGEPTMEVGDEARGAPCEGRSQERGEGTTKDVEGLASEVGESAIEVGEPDARATKGT